jgi:hypothetical protein
MHNHPGNTHNIIANRSSAADGTGEPAAGNLVPHPVLNPKKQKNNYRYTPASGPRSMALPAPGHHNTC